MASTNITPGEYTDKDMQVVAQLAYIDFDEEMFGMTIGEILNNNSYYTKIYNQYIVDRYGENPEEGSNDEILTQRCSKFLDSVKNDPVYSNWKVADVCDTNTTNGFYSLLIETDANSAVVGFRGSESTEGQGLRDWVLADILLLEVHSKTLILTEQCLMI